MRFLIIGFIAILLLQNCLHKEQTQTPYFDKGEEIFVSVWDKYRVHHHNLFSEYYPSTFAPDLTYFQEGSREAQEVSFLWPFSGLFSSTNILMEFDPDHYQPYLDSMVIAVEMYYDSLRKPPGYQAYPVHLDYSDRYYDDNGLVGIDYIDAYNLTNNKNYLHKAKEAMAFIMSGWCDDYGGGVPWLEGVRDQKPACTNGKAAVLAIKIYQATGNDLYLNYGMDFYHWMMNTLKDDSLHIIWNSLLTGDGTVQKHAYTYNTGTMIQSAVRLYKITEQPEYLNDARLLAEGSFNYYVKYKNGDNPYIRDLPWFIVVLFRGYHELYMVDNNPKYINAIIAMADRAWNENRDANGLFNKAWTGRETPENEPCWLLDEACMAELYLRIALIKGENNNNGI